MSKLSNRDVLSGFLFIVIGLAGLYIGWDYKIGTAFRMGPGYFPRVLCGLLVAIGMIVAARGALSGDDPPDRMQARPLALVTLSVLLFAALIDVAGLLPASVVLVVLGALAGPEYRTLETVVLAAILAAGAIGLFKYGLAMSFPIVGFPIPFL